MVFGSILNWIVGRTLDFTLDRIIWVTKTTALGIITLGYYITSRNTNKIKNEKKSIKYIFDLKMSFLKRNKTKKENVQKDDSGSFSLNDLSNLNKNENINCYGILQ